MNTWSILCLIWTLAAYYMAKVIYVRYRKSWLNPAITVPVITLSLMIIFNISYDTYWKDTAWIVQLLAPATVAFAIPIYEYRRLIRQHALALTASITVGMVVGVLSIYIFAGLFHFDKTLTYSLMARSISTPFALDLSEKIHGSPSLVSLFTLITGMVGMILGDMILTFFRIRSHLANGIAFGNASHGFGTARASQRNEDEGVIASLTMILAGLFMIFLGPSLIHGVMLFGQV